MRGFNIQPDTLIKLEEALNKYGKEYHIEVVVKSGMLLKTIDNEQDAIKTIDNINKKLAINQ